MLLRKQITIFDAYRLNPGSILESRTGKNQKFYRPVFYGLYFGYRPIKLLILPAPDSNSELLRSLLRKQITIPDAYRLIFGFHIRIPYR
jgi:hypothetical protein